MDKFKSNSNFTKDKNINKKEKITKENINLNFTNEKNSIKRTEGKLLPLSSDIVFKRVFSREENEGILKDFLEGILGISIKKVRVTNPELPKNIFDEKAGTLDIKATINENTICDIEMQVKDEYNIDKRSLRYAANLIDKQLKVGDNYKDLRKVIVIDIMKFNFYKRNSYHNVARMKFEETNPNEYVDMGYENEDKIATEDIEMHFIELPKFKKKNPNVANKLEQWLWLIEGNGGKIEMAEKENKKIEEAVDCIKEMSMSDEEWELYESRQRWIADCKNAEGHAREEGIKQGKEQGEAKAKKEVAKKLLKEKISAEVIEKVTGLSKEEITKLKRKM